MTATTATTATSRTGATNSKSSLDTEAIKRAYDLRDVVASELGRPARRGAGPYMMWHCPFHPGDNDPSFTVYTDHAYCFGCSWHGDIITWTMERQGLGFIDAYRQLAVGAGIGFVDVKGRKNSYYTPSPISIQNNQRTHVSQPAHPTSMTTRPEPTLPNKHELFLFPEKPPEDWQERMMDVMVECEVKLWDDADPRARAARRYLTGRGLESNILQHYMIGYNPSGRTISIPSLGEGVWLAPGITIPLWEARRNTLYGVNVRLSRQAQAKHGGRKYMKPKGSKRAPLGLDSVGGKSHVFLLEGEFDGMLTLQTLRQMGERVSNVGAFTMGSAASQDIERWLLLHDELLHPVRYLIALDSDGPGQKAAQQWLEAIPGRARLWRPPNMPDKVMPDGRSKRRKDVIDLYEQQGSEGVRWWIEAGLRQHHYKMDQTVQMAAS